MLPFRLRRCVWLVPVGLSAAGCDSPPPAVSTPATAVTPATARDTQPGRPTADKPDLGRLDYDPSAGTLTVYALPGRGGRWLLVTPGGPPDGAPVSGTVSLPAHTDPARACVYYTVPDRRPSPRVTLREIADARTLHAAR